MNESVLKAKYLTENVVLVAAGVGYAVFRKFLAFRPLFIFPLLVICAVYIALEMKWGSRTPADFGLRTDNLRGAFALTGIVFFVPTAGLAIYAFIKGISLPSHFYFTLALYPLWGILQQLVFQGFFLGNLLRLGLGWTAIPIAGLYYSIVHWPSPFMLVATLLGGLGFSTIYYFRRNILPLGMVHGLLGALLFYGVLGRDPFARFIA